MTKFILTAEVINSDYTAAKVTTPVEAITEQAALGQFKRDLGRQVTAGTLIRYSNVTIREA